MLFRRKKPDHAKLLKKYMRVVEFHQGFDFIPLRPGIYDGVKPPLVFAQAELDELNRVHGEMLKATYR